MQRYVALTRGAHLAGLRAAFGELGVGVCHVSSVDDDDCALVGEGGVNARHLQCTMSGHQDANEDDAIGEIMAGR